MATEMIEPKTAAEYRFRCGAHVPQGVTVEGILDERERVAEFYGEATAKASVQCILQKPDAFPNLRAWGPKDPETAYIEGIERGVREAYASIVIVREIPTSQGKSQRVEVRALPAVPSRSGDGLSYEPLSVVQGEPERRAWLIERLQRDAATFSQRLQDTLAELKEIV